MRFTFFLFAVFLFTTPAHSSPSMQEMSYQTVKSFILPTYDRLANAARNQAQVWEKTCDTAKLKRAFRATMLSWAQVQYINFGPVTMLLRRDRLYHWPERRNAVSKGLSGLFSSKDPSSLSDESIEKSSVAIQGFPALERLLYTDLSNDPWSCELGKTISRNIANLAAGTAKDWHELVPFIEKGERHPIHFESMDEVAIRLFTEMLAGFQMIADQKIAPVLGTSLEKAKPKKAEFWRSDLSTLIIQTNIAALEGMAETYAGYLPNDVHSQIETQFNTLNERAADLPSSLSQAALTVDGRERLYALHKECLETRDMLIKALTNHLGLTVGFNSMDGD